jgi:hypothetical protein
MISLKLLRRNFKVLDLVSLLVKIIQGKLNIEFQIHLLSKFELKI